MTDIEALRARMREAAEKATPGPWTRRDTPDYAEMIGDDESRPLALVGKPEDADFIALASPANVKALDAEITRLREDLDGVTRERDEALALQKDMLPVSACGNYVFIDGPGDAEIDHGGKLRALAEAAEAALAKRDEEVARLWDKVEGLSADLTEAVRIAYKYGAATWVQMNYPKQHATLTQEPTNAE